MDHQGSDRTRTLRGALAGAVAATAWGLQQPLDKRLFESDYDDVEVLGRAVARNGDWRAVGFAIHVANGALFGAVYAGVAPRLPVAPVLRGPLAALAEHVTLWPLSAICDRLHPARERLPVLWGNRAAFRQATWRHLLFGVVLGEFERRLNVLPEPAPAAGSAHFSSNGHGSLEHAVVSVHEAG
ncbi:MAG: hypothetical protein ACRDMX_11835 [Solirubrobacteraceae bacterium]